MTDEQATKWVAWPE